MWGSSFVKYQTHGKDFMFLVRTYRRAALFFLLFPKLISHFLWGHVGMLSQPLRSSLHILSLFLQLYFPACLCEPSQYFFHSYFIFLLLDLCVCFFLIKAISLIKILLILPGSIQILSLLLSALNEVPCTNISNSNPDIKS